MRAVPSRASNRLNSFSSFGPMPDSVVMAANRGLRTFGRIVIELFSQLPHRDICESIYSTRTVTICKRLGNAGRAQVNVMRRKSNHDRRDIIDEIGMEDIQFLFSGVY